MAVNQKAFSIRDFMSVWQSKSWIFFIINTNITNADSKGKICACLWETLFYDSFLQILRKVGANLLTGILGCDLCHIRVNHYLH